MKGVLDLKDVVFYLSFIFFGLFLAQQSVESQAGGPNAKAGSSPDPGRPGGGRPVSDPPWRRSFPPPQVYLLAGLLWVLLHVVLFWEQIASLVGRRQLRHGGNTAALVLIVLAILGSATTSSTATPPAGI